MILLGWEIGSGKRVEIPETGHLAWFGQTQLSGKTTALEAIAFRGELRAVAFITKQGEGGFLTGRMIPPYFSEPTNDEEQPLWRWVKSILEAGQQRRMNFEESWIIRACEDPRQAKTLADVHANIKSLLGGEGDYVEKGRGKKKKREWKYTRKPVGGINAGVYTSLKAYFDIVMPQLARLPYSKKLALGPGLNVMDLREYASETQALVIRSVMEWVYQHEKNVRVIVPEAQDFVPQGKNSPVKMACETLVRKAGANKNFMWLDSQDMAAVDKIMLRACSIVGIGVQTEGHEIQRSLDGLFIPTLKPVDIARLKIGEFFVRTPEARVSKVYVQPAWMESELHAQAIAKGEESVASARQMLTAFKTLRNPKMMVGAPHAMKEYRAAPQLKQILSQEPPDVEEEAQKPHLGNLHDGDAGARSSSDGALTGVRSGGSIGRNTNAAIPDGELHGRTNETQDEEASSLGDADVQIEASPAQTAREHADGDQEAHRTAGAVPATGHESGATDPRAVVGHDSPQNLNQQEPGKHETNTSNPGFSRDGSLSEVSSEKESIDPPVRGASSPGGRGQDSTGSEVAMPQKESSAVTMLRESLESQAFHRNMPMLVAPMRDLLIEHAALIQAHDALAARVKELMGRMLPDELYEDRLRSGQTPAATPAVTSHQSPVTPSGNGHGLRFTVPDLEYIWKFIKARADKEGLAELLTRRPELRVKVERTPVTMDDSNLQGRIARLLHEGFFKTPRNGPAVQKELKRRTGIEQPTTNLYKPLNKLTEMGFLTVEQDGYQEVAEMKVMVQKA